MYILVQSSLKLISSKNNDVSDLIYTQPETILTRYSLNMEIRRNVNSDCSYVNGVLMSRVAIIFFELGVARNSMQ